MSPIHESPIHETLETAIGPATDETEALVLHTTRFSNLGQMVVFLVHLYVLYTLALVLSLFPAHRRLTVLAVRTRYALWRLMATGWSE